MALIIWRHPKPLKAEGICLGHTDLEVDQRKVRHLAYKIHRHAQVLGYEKRLYVSPLTRSRRVGEFLAAQLGWSYQIEPALIEFNFGDWDGRPWSQINPAEMDLWCKRFADWAPGDGETLNNLFARVQDWLEKPDKSPRLAVGHAGWITAAKRLSQGQSVPATPQDWQINTPYSSRTRIPHKEF